MPLIETSAWEWIKTAPTKFVEISDSCNLFSAQFHLWKTYVHFTTFPLYLSDCSKM